MGGLARREIYVELVCEKLKILIEGTIWLASSNILDLNSNKNSRFTAFLNLIAINCCFGY